MADDPDVLPYQSDAYVELDALTDAATDAFVNDATVTVTLYSKSGTPVTGASGLTASYVASSDGKYRALIPRTAAVVLGGKYRCDATAAVGGLQMIFSQDVIVERYEA